jgi:hypothetical protein
MRSFQHLFVNGHRRRDRRRVSVASGPVRFRANTSRSRDQRFGQGIDNQDLPNAYARGWYASGTWLLTGEQKKDSVEPERPFCAAALAPSRSAARGASCRVEPGVNDGSFSSPRAPG